MLFAFYNNEKENYIETVYAIVNIKHKITDLLKNHIYSKNEAFRE